MGGFERTTRYVSKGQRTVLYEAVLAIILAGKLFAITDSRTR